MDAFRRWQACPIWNVSEQRNWLGWTNKQTSIVIIAIATADARMSLRQSQALCRGTHFLCYHALCRCQGPSFSFKRKREPARGLRTTGNFIHLSLIEHIYSICWRVSFFHIVKLAVCSFKVRFSLMKSIYRLLFSSHQKLCAIWLLFSFHCAKCCKEINQLLAEVLKLI